MCHGSVQSSQPSVHVAPGHALSWRSLPCGVWPPPPDLPRNEALCCRCAASSLILPHLPPAPRSSALRSLPLRSATLEILLRVRLSPSSLPISEKVRLLFARLTPAVATSLARELHLLLRRGDRLGLLCSSRGRGPLPTRQLRPPSATGTLADQRQCAPDEDLQSATFLLDGLPLFLLGIARLRFIVAHAT